MRIRMSSFNAKISNPMRRDVEINVFRKQPFQSTGGDFTFQWLQEGICALKLIELELVHQFMRYNIISIIGILVHKCTSETYA